MAFLFFNRKSLINTALAIALAIATNFSASAQLGFEGSAHKILTEKPDANSGLDMLYIIYDTQGVTASYKAQNPDKLIWSKFSNFGGGYAEEIKTQRDGDTYSIKLDNDDMGYIIEDGTDRQYYWIINYANHHAELQALTIAEDQECDRARLTFQGYADKINYFTINGASRELSREMLVEYTTLIYDKGNEMYNQTKASQTLASIDQSIGVKAPLCDTYFTLSGDKFLRQWDMEQSIESPNYRAIAVEAQTYAEQETRENDNEQKVDAGSLGGSAPVKISFRAQATDAAIFKEWQMSRDQEFEQIFDRFQELDFDYTFTDNGNTYIRFVANNSAGTCEYDGETYEVYVGESGLLCPNVFSPNGDGVNDEWKVSYKSIVKFECHIYNRWGQEMMSMTDPAIGWDGRYKGKYVPTGVYYYVVKAVGSDGRKYNLNGDINIIKSKGHKEGGSQEGDPVVSPE